MDALYGAQRLPNEIHCVPMADGPLNMTMEAAGPRAKGSAGSAYQILLRALRTLEDRKEVQE